MKYEELKSNRRFTLSGLTSFEVGNIAIPENTFKDSSYEALKTLADTDLHLEVEIAKVTSKGFRSEARSLRALQKDVVNCAERIIKIREKLNSRLESKESKN